MEETSLPQASNGKHPDRSLPPDASAASLGGMKVVQLNHVAIPVADLEASITFFRTILGLEPMPRPDFDFPGAWFRLGPHQELHLIGKAVNAAGPLPRERHTALRVIDIAAARAHLEAHGIPFTGPTPRPDGVPQIFLRDPDGHAFELTQIDGIG